MWHNLDWGWGMGFHMLLWWALMVGGIIAVAGLIFALLRNAGGEDSSATRRGPKL